MKIKFNMPVKLPEYHWISYSVKTNWRPDGKNIGKCLTLIIEIESKEDPLPLFTKIIKANPDLSEVSIRMPVDNGSVAVNGYDTIKMTFMKDDESAEQDADDCSVIHFPPDDPVEWLDGDKK